MTSRRRVHALPLAAAVILTACNGERVLVRDPLGLPIAGARVVGMTTSLATEPVGTDASGEARVPWTPEDLGWVRAWSDGYCPSPELDIRGKPRPVVVVLQRRGTAKCPERPERSGFDDAR